MQEMALRDQPYLPLYVDDYLTDEKLNMCSASTQGVYVRIMCIMHKSENYGMILLKQKDKQNTDPVLNFCLKLSKQIALPETEIRSAVSELIEERVLYIDGDALCQKRMIHDGKVSIERSLAGKKGGNASIFAQAKHQAKCQANTVYVIENEIVNENENIDVPKKVERVITEQHFEGIWQKYPNRQGKKAALRHFLATVKTQESFDNINKALDNYLKCDRVKNGFIKNGSTWFNEWEDWIIPTIEMLNGGNNGTRTTDRPTAQRAEPNKYARFENQQHS